MQLRWKKYKTQKAVPLDKIYAVKCSLGGQNIAENISWKNIYHKQWIRGDELQKSKIK